MSLLDLLSVTQILRDGIALPFARKTLNLIGFTVEDDPANKRINITGGGGPDVVRYTDGGDIQPGELGPVVQSIGEVLVDTSGGAIGQVLTLVATAPNRRLALAAVSSGGGGTGNVVGPDASSAGHLPAFADEAGKVLVDSGTSAADLTDYTTYVNARVTTLAMTVSTGDATTLAAAKTYTDDAISAIPPSSGGGGTGDVVGPASAVNARLAAFDGVTGKLLADSGHSAADILSTISSGDSATLATARTYTDDAISAIPPSGGGAGDVVGPASAVADHVVTYNGTTGKLVKDGGKTLATVASDAASAAAIADAAILAAARAYADAAVAAASGGWIVALDTNLQTESARSFVDGANTWHGVTWLGENISGKSDGVSIDSTGLVFDMNATGGTFFTPSGVNDGTKLTARVPDLCPGFKIARSRLRVTAEIVGNPQRDAEYIGVSVGRFEPPTISSGNAYELVMSHIWDGAAPIGANPIARRTFQSWHKSDREYIDSTSGNTVLRSEWSLDRYACESAAVAGVSTDSNDVAFPDSAFVLEGLLRRNGDGPYAIANNNYGGTRGYTAIRTADLSMTGLSSDFVLSLFAFTGANAFNTFVGRIKRLRIEYKL